MKEIIGNLWDYYNHDHVTCITTNGTLKVNGEGVMGRGCALEAKQRIPGLAKELGKHLKNFGNHVGHLVDKPLPILMAFPVKHNWWEQADLDLIARSAKELQTWMERGLTHKIAVLPRPGCGNGQLKWEEVRPVLAFLPDYVWVISR